MSSPSSRPKRRWAFGAVSTALMTGHAVVVAGALGTGLIALIQSSPMRRDLHRLSQPLMIAVLCAPCLHLVLMLVTPLWSWLAARTRTRVSRLWAWLGYFIPLASYWLPAHTLNQLAEGADPEAPRRRTLILAWGIARGLAAPSFFVGFVALLMNLHLGSDKEGWAIIIYVLIVLVVSNLVALLTIAQMRRQLATGATDESHAEVFT
jgi:hypothetical protein